MVIGNARLVKNVPLIRHILRSSSDVNFTCRNCFSSYRGCGYYQWWISSTKAAQVEMVIHHCIIKYTRAMNEGVCLWNINRYHWWILTNWCNGNERWCHPFCRRCHFLLRWHILRWPNKHDLTKLLYVVEQRGFPSMICRIDCMHWKCKMFYCLG